jgi:hypothetical protein
LNHNSYSFTNSKIKIQKSKIEAVVRTKILKTTDFIGVFECVDTYQMLLTTLTFTNMVRTMAYAP